MSVLTNAKNHFKDVLAQGMKEVEVPEWETTMFFKPATTFAQEQGVVKLHQEGKLTEALVETLITRALDKDGKRVFKGADRVVLMNQVDPAIIMRIITELNSDEAEVQESLEK
jgi:hypothetical protein